jgi:hypothetical protein
MTRNLIAKATGTLWATGSNKAGRRRRGTSPCLENLEGRLSMSGIVGNHIGTSALLGSQISTDIKHAPTVVEETADELNPQPIPPGRRVPTQ